MKSRIAIVLVGTGLVLGCEQGGVPQPPPETDPGDVPATGEAGAAEARAGATWAGAGTLFTEEAPTAAQLLHVADEDTRPDASAGVVFVPMSTFGVERDGVPNVLPPAEELASELEAAGVGGERLVIVGEPIPAGRAWAALDYLGLGDRAALLEGGPAALESAREARPGPDAPTGEATSEAGGAERGGLDSDVRDDVVVDAEWVRERLDEPGVAILDARPPDEYSGDTPGEGIERPGHIPGARNLFWERLVESPDAPRLKNEAELRRVFEEAGVEPGDTVVAYCRTGGQSGFLYTVARHLGYEARFYDGSYVDWTRAGHPVEEGQGEGTVAGGDR